MAKRYVWLKLRENFFSDIRIKKLRRVAGGDTLTIIYLKMQLASLRNDGFLVYEGVENTFAQELALDLDEDEENVSLALSYLYKHGLIEETEEDVYILPQVKESIGSESESAERVREFRKRQRAKLLHCNDSLLLCNDDETTCNTEKEKEKEKEEDKEKENTLSIYIDCVRDVVEYLNLRTGKKFRDSTPKTKNLIIARLKEGFTAEDLKKVIEIKTRTWKGTDMEKFLRPETLFGNKFEGYLNERIPPEKEEMPF